MPTIVPDRLAALAARIFTALGVPDDDAGWVATLLVRALRRQGISHVVVMVEGRRTQFPVAELLR